VTETAPAGSNRRLDLEGCPNFRDLGGYQTTQGRRVKWGYLYRSGQLSNLTETDLQQVAGLGLDLVCDFRREEEQERDPSLLPQPGPRVASLPISPGSNDTFLGQADSFGEADRKAIFNFMVEINRDFALGQQQAYSDMFAHLLAVEEGRMLFHCAAGKDRTGFAAAVIFLALGVSRETIMQDYLLTADYYHPHRELDRLREKYAMDLPAEALLPILEVHPDYLQAGLTAIDEEFASVDVYLEDFLGLGEAELGQLRERYLE
jgi:protein-tyrosine phosphatase